MVSGQCRPFVVPVTDSWAQNNIMGKILPAGMDCAGLWPKYVTTRRGSVVLSIIGIVIQPWRFLEGSSTFLHVLSSFGGKLSTSACVC